ncbi:hypothetical protein D3C75_1194740 [compost metagenome]
MKLVASGKETAHRQILFHRHAGEHAAAFRHNRDIATHDFGGLPLGDVLIHQGDRPFAGPWVAA